MRLSCPICTLDSNQNLSRVMETIAKVLGFEMSFQIVNIFDHFDVKTRKWRGVSGMVRMPRLIRYLHSHALSYFVII